MLDLNRYKKILENYKADADIFDISIPKYDKQMPGYSAIIYSVRKGEFNFPDGEGNTSGGDKFLSCFTSNMSSYEELLFICELSDDMIDVITSNANQNNFKRLNLF